MDWISFLFGFIAGQFAVGIAIIFFAATAETTHD